MSEESKKYRTFSRRAFMLGAIKLALFTLIGIRYYYVEVTTSSKYRVSSNKNRLKLILVNASRGNIYDKNHQLLVSNIATFKLALDNFALNYNTITKIEKILNRELDISPMQFQTLVSKKKTNEYLILRENLTWPDVAHIVESDHLLEGVEVIEHIKRKYHFPYETSHITGYVSTPSKKEIEDMDILPTSEIKIGKNGVEKAFDKQLRGELGFKKIEVNSKGKPIVVLEKSSPISGQDLIISVDLKLQRFIHKLLTDHNLVGSVIVLNAQDGRVLAMHSTPSYDPNLFVENISYKDWDRIINAPNNPLINHAISSPYPPGSTFKLVTACAALMKGWNPSNTIHCSGKFTLASRVFKCWNTAGHGALNLTSAIAQSCNPYFFTLSLKYGIESIHQAATMLGLGEKTGIELFGESGGLIPSSAWKRHRFNMQWYPGDTVNSSIGQGYILATPLQIAVMTARIATGKLLKPTLKNEPLEEILTLGIDTDKLNIIRSGMFECVNSYKGILFNKGLINPKFPISAKTGTAQVVSLKFKHLGKQFHHHGLLTSFAPFDKPRYVVTVVIEHGEAGAKLAPLLKEIYDFIFDT